MNLNELIYPYELCHLPYPYEALEPYIDAKTMQIHHTKHHAGYVNKLNEVIKKYPELQKVALVEILQNLESYDIPDEDKEAIRNFGGGHINHTLFWSIMGPSKEIDEDLVTKIKEAFGSVERFKEEFTNTALSHFGSGWAWLVENSEGQLEIYSLLNQDSPYLLGDTPIIGLDLWEHAYYLLYQNRRAEYVQNWWNVLKLL